MTMKEYVSIKDHLGIIPVNMGRISEETAKDIVWTKIGDIGFAVAYPDEDGLARLITHDDFDGPMAEIMLLYDAGMASMVNHPIQIVKMGQFLTSILNGKEIETADLDEYLMDVQEDDSDFYVVTSGIPGGAAVIAYPNFFDEVEKTIGKGNFFLIPSSVHEILLAPVHMGPPDGLRDILRDINLAEVPEGERLSDNLYYLDLGRREIKMLQEEK